MGVTVCLPLFGNPGHELEEGARVGGPQLRELAAQLQERLHKAADTLDRLAAAGWDCRLAMFDVLVARGGVETQAGAVQALQALGLDPQEFMIVEDVGEEDEGEGA